MRPGTAEPLYVLGFTWWPFDGAVTAAIIALVGTGVTLLFNAHRFKTAEKNQTARHKGTLGATERASERELLLRDMQRAEEALAKDDAHHWVYAGVILREVHLNDHATDADRRRARFVMSAFKTRVTPSV